MPSGKLIAIVAGGIAISLVLLIVVLWATGVFDDEEVPYDYQSGSSGSSGSSGYGSSGGSNVAPPPPPAPSWSMHPSAWIQGPPAGGLDQYFSGSVDQCKEKCLATPGCQSFCHKSTGCYIRGAGTGSIGAGDWTCAVKN